MGWEFERGSLPRCSTISLWVISCHAVTARTLRHPQVQAIAYPWVEMWSICKYSGQIRIGSGTLIIHKGCVALSPGALTLLNVSDVSSTLLTFLAKLTSNALLVPVPTLALVLNRIASLKNHERSRASAQVLALNFIHILERFVFQESTSILRQKLSNPVRYEYRCGRRQTRNDPRMQVGYMLAATCPSTHCWGVASSPPMVFTHILGSHTLQDLTHFRITIVVGSHTFQDHIHFRITHV